ncbi:MAG: glycosyltransferase family protein [Anaerolineae bacterium]|nr:glycosyltransferase family protein [Anaerolineae bacterium]
MPPLNIVTVIQARRASLRLPDKVMLPLAGEPLLVRMVERVQAATLSGTVVVATTFSPEDDPIQDLCLAQNIICYRGHPFDLLDRHYRVGYQFNADAVVKIPSDCPLIDPHIIDRVIGAYLAEPKAYDYVSNLHPPSYPDGNDVEIMSLKALGIAWREAWHDFQREHTTPYLWENPDRFRLHNVLWETGLNYAMTHRWVLDYAEDYQLISAVYDALYPHNPNFGLFDILDLLTQRPDIAAINQKYAGVNWYRHHLDELKTIDPADTRIPAEEQAL